MSELNSCLFADLLANASDRVVQILKQQDAPSSATTAALRTIICDLEMSPILDKQLVAVGLRLSENLDCPSEVRPRLLNRFRSPAPSVAIEAQRREIERDVKHKGLPMELAGDYVRRLEKGLYVPEEGLPDILWNYASIYDNIWSDPRIGARSPTRRIMLGMTTVLRARSAELVAERGPRAATARPNPSA